jgi:hypothetical protein
LTSIYAVQVFRDEVWRTVHATTNVVETHEVYDRAVGLFLDWPVRKAEFVVDSLDFLGTQCRDFRVLASRS